MQLVNRAMPNENQQTLLEEDAEGAVFMVNLLKFRDKAVYEDGRETDLTGKEAYGIYGQGVAKLVSKYNAELVLYKHINELIIGEVDELWDEVAVVKYASRSDLRDMLASQEWNALNVHRLAGLEGQLLIESRS